MHGLSAQPSTSGPSGTSNQNSETQDSKLEAPVLFLFLRAGRSSALDVCRVHSDGGCCHALHVLHSW